jgi:hypothetical protein
MVAQVKKLANLFATLETLRGFIHGALRAIPTIYHKCYVIFAGKRGQHTG